MPQWADMPAKTLHPLSVKLITPNLIAKLTGTYDSLTPLTAEKVEGINEGGAEAEEAPAEEAPAAEVAVGGAVQGAEVKVCGGVLVLNIAEGKGIHIELPI